MNDDPLKGQWEHLYEAAELLQRKAIQLSLDRAGCHTSKHSGSGATCYESNRGVPEAVEKFYCGVCKEYVRQGFDPAQMPRRMGVTCQCSSGKCLIHNYGEKNAKTPPVSRPQLSLVRNPDS